MTDFLGTMATWCLGFFKPGCKPRTQVWVTAWPTSKHGVLQTPDRIKYGELHVLQVSVVFGTL